MFKEFSCIISCMDGRIQIVVNEYMRKKYNTLYIDTITVAGPAKIIANNVRVSLIDNLKFRANLSITRHLSKVIAIVGHHDCATIEEPEDIHKSFIRKSAKKIKTWFQDIEVISLWVNSDFEVEEM